MEKQNNPKQMDLFPDEFPVKMTQEWLTDLLRTTEERVRKEVFESIHVNQMHPVCIQTGCKQDVHFRAIRKLQQINEHLEKYANHLPTCKHKLFGSEFACDCGFSGVTNVNEES